MSRRLRRGPSGTFSPPGNRMTTAGMGGFPVPAVPAVPAVVATESPTPLPRAADRRRPPPGTSPRRRVGQGAARNAGGSRRVPVQLPRFRRVERLVAADRQMTGTAVRIRRVGPVGGVRHVQLGGAHPASGVAELVLGEVAVGAHLQPVGARRHRTVRRPLDPVVQPHGEQLEVRQAVHLRAERDVVAGLVGLPQRGVVVRRVSDEDDLADAPASRTASARAADLILLWPRGWPSAPVSK